VSAFLRQQQQQRRLCRLLRSKFHVSTVYSWAINRGEILCINTAGLFPSPCLELAHWPNITPSRTGEKPGLNLVVEPGTRHRRPYNRVRFWFLRLLWHLALTTNFKRYINKHLPISNKRCAFVGPHQIHPSRIILIVPLGYPALWCVSMV